MIDWNVLSCVWTEDGWRIIWEAIVVRGDMILCIIGIKILRFAPGRSNP